MFYVKKYSIILLSCILFSCSQGSHTAVFSSGAVASPDKYGAQVATQILNQGGNAVDAAVATAFALAVTYPEAGNIGGGGFMTLYMDKKPYFLDYREVAPASASKDMFLDDKGNVVPNSSTYSYKAIGVPGTVSGMWEAHNKFGKLPWKDVLQPAIDLAINGFVVDKELLHRYQDNLPKFPQNSYIDKYFGKMKADEVFKQEDLGKVLQQIAQDGSKAFYTGPIAQNISEQILKGGGLITLEDMKAYKAKWREPLEFTWNNMQFITSPPPSSGGFALDQLLNIKSLVFSRMENIMPFSSQYYHLLAEIEKRVYADRGEYLGDSDFVDVPLKKLMDPNYLEERSFNISVDSISPTDQINPGLGNEKKETTHFSIVDKWGNAVSNTYTLNGYFGSGILVDGTGIVLNNEMDDFSVKSGVPNQFGVIGNDNNAIAPNKRPLSSMAPTIITQNGEVQMVIGTPGGSRIPTTIFQVLLNVYDNHLPLDKAVALGRYHHQLFPKDTIFIEKNNTDLKVNQELIKMGYTISDETLVSGNIQAIQIINKKPYPVSDPRSRGVSLLSNE